MSKNLPIHMTIEFPADERKAGEIVLLYKDGNIKRMPVAMSSPYGIMMKGLRLGCHNETLKW